MTKSFTEYQLEIEYLSGGNELLKSMLLDSFYKNIPGEINRNIKKVLNDFYLSFKRKELWKCNHENCDVSSCYSHEISENIFLKQLSDENSKVVILDKNVSGNVFFYREKKVHKRNASNFPGYCSDHDAKLFSDIENGNQSLDSNFVNKQCLRSLRRRSFDLEIQVKGAEKMLSQIDEGLGESVVIKELVSHFEEKKSILLKKNSIIKDVYEKVLFGINSGRYCISFKDLGSAKAGYCFSQVFDCTAEDDVENCMLFLYKIDFPTGPKVFVCWLDNNTSEEVVNSMGTEFKLLFIDFMYDKKDKLVLSSNFLEGMDSSMKEVFYQDSEIYNINTLEKVLLAKEFF